MDGISFLALLGGGSLLLRSLARRPGNPGAPVAQAWTNALAPYGTPVEGDSSALARIRSREGALQIRVEARRYRPDLVSVVLPDPLALADVEIRKAAYGLPVRESESGDSQFESMFYVAGPGSLVSSLLDAETRRLMMSLDSDRLEIADGQVRAAMAVAQAPRLLPPLLDIAKRVARPLDVAERLAENALNDPVPEVRLRNLVLLLREAPRDDPKTLAALRAACADRNPWIRLRAASALGAEGHAVLAELTESVEDEVSEEAVLLLGRHLTLQRTREILAQAVDHHHHRTARACLEPISLGGNAADVEVLANVMAVQNGELAAAAAQALKTLGSPAAEPSLILALQRKQEDLQVAAAIALGRLGSAAAVLPLKEVAGSARRSALRKAAREAVVEIQSRLQGASPGQLSLAGTDVGHLSLAQAEGGELSIAPDPAGRLSLGDGEEEV